jgi:RNA polymerase sigma-70 factor (ECF subfamily)
MNIELIKRLQKKDVAALEEVHRTYRKRVLAHAMQVLRDPQDAEEVLQDVMWTAFRKASTLEAPATFDTWLYRVTRNSCLMLLRKRKRVPIAVSDEVVSAISEKTWDNPYEPDRMLARRDALQQAQRAFESLQPTSRKVFHDMDVAGRSKEDVAADLGISVPALKARLHRARVAIRAAFVQPLAI